MATLYAPWWVDLTEWQQRKFRRAASLAAMAGVLRGHGGVGFWSSPWQRAKETHAELVQSGASTVATTELYGLMVDLLDIHNYPDMCPGCVGGGVPLPAKAVIDEAQSWVEERIEDDDLMWV